MKKINWNETLEKIREKIQEDPAQTRAFSHIVKFFLLMLLLTLIARGTSGATLARVELSQPTQQTIVKNLLVSGTVEAQGRETVAVPAGLTVSQLLVQPGAQVEQGDGLVEFDAQDISDTLARKQAQRQQMLVQLEALQEPQTVSDAAVASAQRNLDRANAAQTRAEEALSEAEATLAQATKDLTTAETALTSAPEEEKQAAQEAVQTASARVQAAEAERDMAEQSAQSAKEAAQDASDQLGRAEESYAEAQKQAGRTDETNAASANLLQLDIDALESEILTLTALQSAGCRLSAPATGTVSDIPLTLGAATGGSEQITLATQTKGYLLTFQTTKAEADLLQSGMKTLYAVQGSLVEELSVFYAAPDTAESPDTVTFTATLLTPGWSSEPVTVSSELSKDSYGTCVPLSAIHQDAEGSYVYAFRSKLTILGLQNLAVRVDVTVLNSDGEFATISGGLDPKEQIISGSSKPLSNGDRVRVEA